MAANQENTSNANAQQRVSLGRAVVPIQFGEQVIVSLLYNHDANPVHHRPDHALQWMLGLFSSPAAGAEDGLESATPEERLYTLGAKLLSQQDVVVMPGIILAAICYERFVPPSEMTVSLTTTFTYPLLVPTKGSVEVSVEAFEVPADGAAAQIPGCRNIQIEAFAPGVSGRIVRLLKMDALVFRANVPAKQIVEEVVRPKFDEFMKLSHKLAGFPALTHPSSISQEDRRRYLRIVEPAGSGAPQDHGRSKKTRPITACAWQCKIPRVLTEVIDYLRYHEAYLAEVKAYYAGRADEAERREAIKRYVAKEIKYRRLPEAQGETRVNELMELRAHLYARQQTVFDPRCFRDDGCATSAGTQMLFDLQLSEIRLRRNIHRLFTRGRIKDEPVFMGEATVTAQPLVSRELANFLCEINYSFETLKLMQYK